MRRIIMAALALLMLAVSPAAIRADDFTNGQLVLLKLFGPDPITPDMFAPGFLAQVSMDQLLAVFSRTRAVVGPPVSIEISGSGYVVHTATYAIPVDLGLDRDGRVAALLLHTPVQNFAGVPDVLAAVDGLPGNVAYLVTRNGDTLYGRQETTPVAVSSGFKLAVLAAVADDIAAGRLAWSTVLTLDPGEKSLPPGQVQTLPPGSPLTVHTLAALMVSQSDDTATDMLIDRVGRDKVAAQLGVPFVLKTAEFYKLKADPALRLRYAAADAAGRLKVAADMAALPLSDPGTPLDPDVEWFVPTTTLCRLIEKVADLDVFTINIGVARRADWTGIAFKGGSEVGVATLTSALTDRAGNHYCASVTWNDSRPLDEQRFTSLYGSLLARLAGN